MRAMETLHVYVDESCKDGFKFLAIGGIAVEESKVERCLQAFARARVDSNVAEVKWSALRKTKLPFYKRFVSEFFELTADDTAHFHGLYYNTETAKHAIFNQGSADIGFDKLIYQLLLHKFGIKYGQHYRIEVFLDNRRSNQHPQSLRPWLNADLAKRGIHTRPFKDIRFLDSKKSDLLQATDLLVGAVGTRKNGLHKQPTSAAWKRDLGTFIAIQAAKAAAPYNIEDRRAKRFTLWPYRHGVGRKWWELGFLGR